MSIFLSMFNRRDTFILEVYSCIIQEDNALNCRLCRWVHPNMGETCSMDEVTSHRVFENIFHQLKCEGTLVSLRRKSFRILFPIKIRGIYDICEQLINPIQQFLKHFLCCFIQHLSQEFSIRY
ncbi:hypothetical protein MtrunA17_Chr5g0431411 [Medicago truncatula]|uniref:Uncharacterized protein n=1 Tax=Medicago truncatula TaxID=3880 RepID=A0A396HTF8_MEDTR|nr:hypothetical protein MtrunA17_Chr5g0431411 [Medicago truncatula]